MVVFNGYNGARTVGNMVDVHAVAGGMPPTNLHSYVTSISERTITTVLTSPARMLVNKTKLRRRDVEPTCSPATP